VALAYTGSFGPPVSLSFTSQMLASKGLKGASKGFKVRDIFGKKDEGEFKGTYKVHVPTSSVHFVKVTAA